MIWEGLAPQVGLEPTTLRLTEAVKSISHISYRMLPYATDRY